MDSEKTRESIESFVKILIRTDKREGFKILFCYSNTLSCLIFPNLCFLKNPLKSFLEKYSWNETDTNPFEVRQ
ncbi:MAG: hypothetical protein HDT10_01105 [Helicobacter sp.]|nr:hypothetical protein [Helicobacter sp.]